MARVFTEEHKEKIRQALKGRRLPEEVKRKVSETCKARGVGKWMKGRSLPEGTLTALRVRAEASRGVPRTAEVKEKISKANRGENHPCWKGGITDIRVRLYFTNQYKNWRTSVFVRDDYTCVECGERGGKLAVDHINPFALLIHEVRKLEGDLFTNCLAYEPLWDTDNGRTLCYPCHYKTPNFGGKAIKLYEREHVLG